MKKILVINTKYRIYGGEDSNIKDELKLLNRKYETLYLEFDNRERLNINDIFSFIFRTNPRSNTLLKEAIVNFNPDLVYIHNLWFKGQLGIFKILEKNKIKVAHKIHNFRYQCTNTLFIFNHINKYQKCPMCGLERGKFSFFNFYYHNSRLKSLAIIFFSKRYLYILKKYNLKILVLNEFHKLKLIDAGVIKEKISIYYNPINLDEDFKYSFKSDYVVYAGRLDKTKGILELVEAWKKIKIKNLKLVIIGSGPLENELRKNYENNIEYLGLLTNEETKNFIKGARAVVTTTKLFEGQPKLLSEASSYGVPSIYPSFGGMDEYFPKNYQLKFEQYNQSDLIDKLNTLDNEDLLNSVSKNISVFTKDKLNIKTMIKMFESAVQN